MKPIPFLFPLIAYDQTFMVVEDILPYGYNELHYHRETQLTYIIKGSGNLFLENTAYPFRAGDLFLIGTNQPHMFKSDPQYFHQVRAGQTHFIHIVFDHERVLGAINGIPELRQVAALIRRSMQGLQLPARSTSSIANDIGRLPKVAHFDRLMHILQVWSTLAELPDWTSLLTDYAPAAFADVEEERLRHVYRYTIDHFDKDISLKQAASVASLSMPAFCKYFKKHTRKTYLAFLNEIRINEACNRMLNRNYASISSIAYDTGFSNLITFDRVFKKIIGKTPKAYLEQCRAEVHYWS